MILARQRLALPSIPWRPILAVVVILALLATALFVASQQRRVPAPFGPARNGAIVYERDGDLYARDAVDAPERLIAGGPSVDIAPGFTRDGRKLTFLRTANGDGPGALIDLVVADGDGSNAVTVATNLIAPNWGDLSPDDSLFIVHAADPTQSSSIPDDLRSRLYRIDLRHPGTPQPIDLPGLSAETVPSFRGPDGAEIVFRGFVQDGATVRSGVFAARPDGSNLHPLTPTDGIGQDGYQQPLLSPDGRFLTYTSWLAPNLQIHLRDLGSGEDRIITGAGLAEGYATFSPDGSRIVFVRYGGDTAQVFVMPVAPGSTAVAAGPTYRLVDGYYLGSSFSPDGRFVIVNDPFSKETRLVDAINGGMGDVIPWASSGFGWQRLAP
jgi:Tol biopolymer transport system component